MQAGVDDELAVIIRLVDVLTRETVAMAQDNAIPVSNHYS